MPSVQVKNVPAEVHATLTTRAAAAGQSLQEYLLGLLTEQATSATLDEVLDRAARRSGGRATFADVAKTIGADRARR